ncbi:sigma-54-dependent transcriptional regulator [Aestuariirhabdus litorea]|uniref:Sigma-54-dependent Fis family transcriptional regulator n=1 Tax=Aestuariirhabdus litorea TaxID=2528527 RepID=A0A3P3VMT3_9GAMM|nr:sigma-54 dependent transcriptional regulator [Aestuariirhabdus litorea]RRJ84071.1 sigma-54-dependent Fis family transcriptional regulator [Aestuariirhabdus litorea]RWW97291.1 response regulator [Endozoicomonadaceae bacterium GTF-13]
MSVTEQDHLKGPVIFVDDEHHIRVTVQQTLELEDYSVRCFGSGGEVLDELGIDWPGVIVSDINMPGMDGIELMKRIREIDPDLPVILVTGHGDISMAVAAIRDGAYDFIEKPFASELLVDVVKRALEKRNLTLENRNLRREIEAQSAPGPRILGNTQSIRNMRRIIHQVLNAPTDILINGETGTGKELVARYLHEHSVRREKNFVAINCGAVPENLIESELFGHEAGAFTGADKSRVGKFEYANGGTLFLDEIESMPMAVQVKLLRVIEERMVERLGSNELIPLDIRIVAATKVDLKELSDEGNFRSDLFYRLNIVTIDIPALRDRLEDLPLLFEHFALIASARYQQEIIPLPGERMQQLLQHDWPGNVRELRNLAERYVLLGDEANLVLTEQGQCDELQSRRTLSERVDQFERSLIHEALQRNRGSIKETMVSLGLARKTLYDKMKKHDLDRLDYK